MRYFFLFTLLIIGFQSCAESPSLESTFQYRVDSVRANPQIASGKCKVVVRILNDEIKAGDKLLYGYEGTGFETAVNDKRSFHFELNSGGHVFQFLPADNRDYTEITTATIQLKSGTTTYMTVQFIKEMDVPRVVKKPVIYLYPNEKTRVSVSIKPKGNLSFTYPTYDGKWECTALPTGELFIDHASYNYLFWEAEQSIDKKQFYTLGGSVVAKEELVRFLESALDQFGFTSKEKMDFITFWAPQMIAHDATEIRFMLNEDCSLIADLEIEPKPENLLRFYMIWNPMDVNYIEETVLIEIPEQNRTGFTVLEWGGMEIPQQNRLESLKDRTASMN